ncbi:SwmB domain-containing protein [Paenibacillus sp. PDC88]|uniref:SwmB domain-containing protein n=1 Tax=Paenibacillus sp. PDC88 TaxID=1884375 RepID=UPI00089A41AE|nr:SwmB domain-containing protein [Paenibacillus sp. PDC88]SDW84118.1 repeat-containing protein [Paenibacillus sp. PDC88]
MKKKISLLLTAALCAQMMFSWGMEKNYAAEAGVTQASTQIEDVKEISPYTGQVEVAQTPSLTMELTQPVKKGEGSIRIRSLSDNKEVKAFDLATEVKIYETKGGNEVSPEGYGTYITMNLGTTQLQSGGYYVLIDAGTFMKEQGVPFAGILDASKWRFWTVGMGEVPVVEKVPANGASGILPTSTLTLQFAKEMYPAAGAIQIINRKSGQTVETISSTSSNVSGGGTNTIKIKPSILFENNTSYDVLVSAGAFWDAQQNRSAEIREGDWRFLVSTDTTALIVTSLSPYDGNMSAPVDQPITLTFNKALDTNYPGNVTLRKAGGSVVNTTTVINDKNHRQLVISPAAQLEHNMTYQVDVPGGVFRDAAGNIFGGLVGSSSWSFKTFTRDTTAPVLQTSKMYSNKLIRLTYDEWLNSNTRPLISSYSVTVNGETRGISDVSISGDSVYIMLDTGVAVGQVVRLSYTPGIRPLQDDAGNAVAAYSSREIINDLDSVLSKPREGTVYGNTLYLYFTESVKVTSSSAKDQFVVTADGSSIGISSISISNGSVVTLTLDRSVRDGEVIRVNYTPGSYSLKDNREQSLAGFTDFFVRNSNDTKAPELLEVTASGNKMYVRYNEALRTNDLPLKSQFSVLVNRAPLFVNAVEAEEDTVTLTLASTIQMNQDVTLSYIPGVKRLTDLNYNPAGYINLVPVTVYGSGSVRQAEVQGSTVLLTMTEAMQGSGTAASQFTVNAGGQNMQPTTAAVQGQTLTLTLSNPVLTGQAVTMMYTPGTTPLRTAAGELIAGFGPITLQNKTTGSTNPSSGSGGAAGMPSGLSVLNSGLFNETGYALSTAATKRTTALSKYNRAVGSYTVSADTLKQAFAFASSASGVSKMLVVEVPETEAAAMVGFPVQTLDELKRQYPDAVIGVRYGDRIFTVSVSDLDLTSMAARVYSDITKTTLYLQIEEVPSSSSVAMDTMLSQASATKLSAYTDVSSFIVSDTSTKAEVALKGQLKLRLSSMTNSRTLGVVKLDSTIQRLSPVPSKISQITDAVLVQANLSENHALIAANHPVQYMGLYGHWGKEAVEGLAAKWIIDTAAGAEYGPNTAITRAEFAGMIARALGLNGSWDTTQQFGDVPYNVSGAYIGAAAKAGIITGHQDGTFKPNQLITREQMAIMMVRALHYGGHDSGLNGSANSILSKFKDRAYIQAPNIVAEAVQQGIIEGMTQNTFKPGGNATRAQAAVMITRMLSIYTE